MLNWNSIRPCGKNQYRFDLSIEDIDLDLDQFVEYSLIVRGVENGESFYAFTEAFPCPDFNMFYRTKIKGLKDPYLAKLIDRLLYLNKGISDFALKNLATSCIYRWVQYVDGVPVITNEQFCSAYRYAGNQPWDEKEPTSTRVVLFSRDTKLDSTVRANISRKFRLAVAQRHADQLALNVVEFLAESETLVKITHNRIAATAQSLLNAKMTPYLSKVSESETRKERMAEVNLSKPFKTDKTEAKYLEYKNRSLSSLSIDKASKELGVSKSTIVEFKNIGDV